MGLFTKAIRSQSKLRLAISGPSGSGKTLTALLTARGLVGLDGKIAVIDTENGSASKYAHLVEFDVLNMDPPYSPLRFAEYVREGAKEYDVVIVDSISHAWSGSGGVLEMVEDATKRTRNSYTAWREVTPMQNRMIDAIVSAPSHVIVAMRAKQDYVLEENDKGKKAPRKVGMAPVQREGLEYEFDIFAEMDLEHNFIVSKTRIPELDRLVLNKPSVAFGVDLSSWLSEGALVEDELSEEWDRFTEYAAKLGVSRRRVQNYVRNNPEVKPPSDAEAAKSLLESIVAVST